MLMIQLCPKRASPNLVEREVVVCYNPNQMTKPTVAISNRYQVQIFVENTKYRCLTISSLKKILA